MIQFVCIILFSLLCPTCYIVFQICFNTSNEVVLAIRVCTTNILREMCFTFLTMEQQFWDTCLWNSCRRRHSLFEHNVHGDSW